MNFELNIETLIRHSAHYGRFTIGLVFNGTQNFLRVYRASDIDYSSIYEDLEFSDIQHILNINKCLGEESMYEVLAKYLTQIVFASRGKDLFPEINYLKKHNGHFHRED